MIKLTDLAAVLVEKAELTKREADFFIPLFYRCTDNRTEI